MNLEKLIVIDTETTGVGPNARLVQLAWRVHDDDIEGALREAGAVVVAPDGFEIPPGAAAVHGITTERAAAEGVPLRTAMDTLAATLDRWRPRRFVAHNVDFDRRILLGECRRLGDATLFDRIEGLTPFCTMRAATRPGERWPRLQALHERCFGRRFEGAHSADADAQACADILFYHRRREAAAKGIKGIGEGTSVID